MNSKYKYIVMCCEIHYNTLYRNSKLYNYTFPLYILTAEKKVLELCLETGDVVVYDKEEYVFDENTNYTYDSAYFIRTIMETRRNVNEE